MQPHTTIPGLLVGHAQDERGGQIAVAVAGEDGLQGLDEGAERGRCLGGGGELLEEGSGGARAASTELFGHGEREAAYAIVVLAAVAAIGEEAFDGLVLRLRGVGGVSGVGLDAGKDVP